MWIFKTFFDSLFKPESYYPKITKPKHNFLIYFVFWMTFIGLCLGLYTQLIEIPRLKTTLNDKREEFIASYPEDLVIGWDQEKLVVDPAKYDTLEIIIPKNISPNFTYPQIKYRADEQVIPTMADPNQVEIYVSTDSAYLPNTDLSWQKMSLKAVPFFDQSFTITKDNFPQLLTTAIDTLNKYLDQGMPFVYLFFVIFIVCSRLLLVAFYTLLVFFLGKISQFPKNWSQSWRFTALIFVLAEFISQIANLTYTQLDLPMFILSFWIITTYIMLIIIRKNLVKK